MLVILCPTQFPLHFSLFFVYLFIYLFCVQVGDSLIDQGFDPYPQKGSQASSLLCATEYQFEPQHLRLPVLNPFDNFLKAAGC
jgi:hypothetical protein